MASPPSDEEPLSGGNSAADVVRIGNTVRRHTFAASPATHALLRHLQERGFAHSPHFLGVDERGREILTFHSGQTVWERGAGSFSDEEIARLGEVIRELHRSLRDFAPPEDSHWSDRGADPLGGHLVLHNDLGPWNLVVDGDVWTIIDWDEAAPGRPEWELALVLQSFVPLWPDETRSDAEIVDRIRSFGEGYGATDHRLEEVVALIPERCRRFVEMIDQGVRDGDPQLLKMLKDGHRAVWSAAATHADARKRAWIQLLGG
jgi:Ser/Thr protein kinase RdoA (MazF antagonist)